MQIRPAAARFLTEGFVALALATALPAPAAAERRTQGPVEAQMRNVDFYVDPAIALRIAYLRGRLQPTREGRPPWFDDTHSFRFEIDTAEVAISTAHLAALLNRYVFAYRGAPLRGLALSIEGTRLRQRGRMNGMPFSLLSDVSVTPGGLLRLRPVAIKAFGIPVKGLLERLGMRLDRMMNLQGARGVQAQGNDLLLDPAQLLPPPGIAGRLAGVQLRDSVLIQTFRPRAGPVPAPLALPVHAAAHYMYYRGGTLRFGRLTMKPADLLILDADPRDRFAFFLETYDEQLVAGFSRNTAIQGLITTLPDYRPGRGAAHLP